MYICMHVCPKRQIEVSIRSEKEDRKTGNPVHRKNPILKKKYATVRVSRLFQMFNCVSGVVRCEGSYASLNNE